MKKPVFFKIFTPYGDVFDVSKDGDIVQGFLHGDENTFSYDWKLHSLQSVKSNFNIPFADISEEKLSSIELNYKNRNPKFTVCDIDHGTRRIWGNTVFHGIASIKFM